MAKRVGHLEKHPAMTLRSIWQLRTMSVTSSPTTSPVPPEHQGVFKKNRQQLLSIFTVTPNFTANHAEVRG